MFMPTPVLVGGSEVPSTFRKVRIWIDSTIGVGVGISWSFSVINNCTSATSVPTGSAGASFRIEADPCCALFFQSIPSASI